MRERIVIVAPGGAVTVTEMPADSPREIVIAGTPYLKRVFQPEAGAPGRWVYSIAWPLEQHMIEKVRWLLREDDRKQRSAARLTDVVHIGEAHSQ